MKELLELKAHENSLMDTKLIFTEIIPESLLLLTSKEIKMKIFILGIETKINISTEEAFVRCSRMKDGRRTFLTFIKIFASGFG